MSEPFKLRYADRISGVFVLSILLALAAYVFYAGGADGWFTPARRVNLQLPAEGSMGLKSGADVLILGTVVGSIDDITVDSQGQMLARARIREDFMRFIRQDSTATIRRPLGFGDAYMEISRSNGPPLGSADAVLAVSADLAPTQMLQETIGQVRSEAVPAIKELRAAISEYALLAAEFRSPGGNLQQALGRIDRIAASLDSGQGTAGKLLNDPKLADEIAQSLPKLNKSLDEMQTILQDVRRSTASLPEVADSVREEMKHLPEMLAQTRQTMEQIQVVLKDIETLTAQLPKTVEGVHRTVEALPGLILQTEESLRQVQRLTEAAQRSWLVRPYMDQSDTNSHIAPERVGGGRGEPLSVWRRVPIMGLFCVSFALALPGCAAGPAPKQPLDAQYTQASTGAGVAFDRGLFSEAASLNEQALQRAVLIDSPREISDAEYNLAACLIVLGQFGTASSLLQDSQIEADRAGIATSDILLLCARTAQLETRAADASALADKLLSDPRSSAFPSDRSAAYVLKGELSLAHDDLAGARADLMSAEKEYRNPTPAVLAGPAGLRGYRSGCRAP